mmetsp:Transcript_23898/g.59380  ORF Transcript_23898/g.59380 Transcript_23898/m.59380 type:complete len:792 (+) Transcript_23898:26-2401(+)
MAAALVLYACALLAVLYAAGSSMARRLHDATPLAHPVGTVDVQRPQPAAPVATARQLQGAHPTEESQWGERRAARPAGKAQGRGGRGRRGRGRGRGRARSRITPQGRLRLGSCALSDEALLQGSSCEYSAPEGCPHRYIMLRVHGNDKFLAPREQGVVYAAVRARFRNEGSVPLQRIAWKVVPQARGYVQLQHVLTGKFLRLVPPPHDIAWCFVVVADPAAYGKQTWFQLQTADGQEVDLASSYGSVHLRAHVTGAFLNYRTEDFVRGHGNAMRGGGWTPADRSASTRLQLVSLSLTELKANIVQWEERKRACLSPCENASASALEAKEGRTVWQEHCWKHYAEPLCNAMAQAQHMLPGISWGRMPRLAQLRWSRMDCEKYVSAESVQELVAPGRPLPPLQKPPVVDRIPSLQPGGVHCVPPVEGVVLLAVADRPNQFLCHFFNSALRHKLQPVVLGWNPESWLDVKRKPWTYHLGAKLLLPLHYLRRCNFPKETLVVFTDQDVVFQADYAGLKRSYQAASAADGGAHLVFSTEKESYPLELSGFYPRTSGGVFEFLNSGMWAGPVEAAVQVLEVMTAVHAEGQPLFEQLMRHYINWGRLNTNVEHVPSAFLENDQTKYAGLYLAQAFAQSCNGGPTVPLRGHGCFRFLHDGRSRCSRGGAGPDCGHQAGTHALKARIGLDRRLALFENMYHAGPHHVVAGRIRNERSGTVPAVVHFNGPAKVVFESEWRLPWDAQAGHTPVHELLQTQAAAFSAAEREAAINRFETDVTFLDPLFRLVPDTAPFRFQCEA